MRPTIPIARKIRISAPSNQSTHPVPARPAPNSTVTWIVHSRKKAILKSIGGLVQTVALVILVGLIPYSVFAAYLLAVAVSSLTGNTVGPLIYCVARFVACLLLVYALWRLRQAGSRLRNDNSS